MATVDKQGVRVEYVPLAELRRWPRNPKGHDLGTLHESYDRFGYVMPMLLDERTGKLAVGHGRLDALQQRKASGKEAPGGIRAGDGAWSVPVVRGVSFETDAEMDAYVIADNRLTETGGWDEAALSAVLADLAVEGEGLRGVGYDKDDLDALLASLASEPEPDPGAQVDKAAELQEKWQVETGDLWEIGAHRLVCGDCTDGAVVEQVMGGERVGAVVTDPPYGINREGIVNDDPEGLRALFDGALAVMPIKNAVMIAFQSPRLFPVWLDAVRAAGHKFERALWFYDETDITFPWRGWLMTSQIALVSSLGSPQWASGAEYHHDCYIVKTAGQQDDSGGHTAAKPLDVVQDLVSHTCGTVYDPFLGSGTTMVACEQLHRRCFGIEIEPKYCSVVLERLAGMGLEPRRAE